VEIITTANSLLQPQQVMNSVMQHISRLVPCEAWSVLIAVEEESGKSLEFAATSGPHSDVLVKSRLPLGEGIAGWVGEHGKPLIVNKPSSDQRFLSSIDDRTRFQTRNILAAPLISRGRTIGVIEMLNRTQQPGFSNLDLELVQIFLNPVAVAIENAYLFQKTELDGFKGINDRFGHLQGSRSLIEVAEIIRHAARETDIVGRYGGDEFMVILPATGTGGAFAVAERIRENIEAYKPKGHHLSASIGISTCPDHGNEKERLFALADNAMYWVKEHGKNGIAVARGEGFVVGDQSTG
jgi:diguanylate cyclase (GGDEF)-like protein